MDNAVMLGANYLTGGRAGYSQVNWNAMASDAGDLGGFLGSQARGYLLNRYKINGETGERMPGAGANDSWYDALGAGFFEYAGKLNNMVKNGLKDAGQWVRNTAGDFVESVGNMFQHGEFATDESIRRAYQIEESQHLWGNGTLDDIHGIMTGSLQGDYMFDDNGELLVKMWSPDPLEELAMGATASIRADGSLVERTPQNNGNIHVTVANDGVTTHDFETENMPSLARNTSAAKLIRVLAAEHKMSENEMREQMLLANGVGSVAELQGILRNGGQLFAAQGQGWVNGMQSMYYNNGISASEAMKLITGTGNYAARTVLGVENLNDIRFNNSTANNEGLGSMFNKAVNAVVGLNDSIVQTQNAILEKLSPVNIARGVAGAIAELFDRKTNRNQPSSVIQDVVASIRERRARGEDISPSEVSRLMHSMWQASGQPLSDEIAGVIEMNRKDYNFNNESTTRDLANRIANEACVLTTLYANILLNSPDGKVPGSFGEFYKLLHDKRLISKADDVSINLTSDSYQRIVDTVVGKGILSVEFYSGRDAYANMLNTAKNGDFNYGTVRYENSWGKHNMLLANENGNLRTYDSGRPGNPLGPREHGTNYKEYIEPDNIRSFYYLRRINRRR